MMHAVSLFSNCGAGDLGFAQAGFTFDVMAEIDPRRLEVSLLNHPHAVGVPGDLCQTWLVVVEKYKERAKGQPLDLLAACPPCQGMSSVKSNRGKADDPDAGSRDSRNLLVVVIARVANELKPAIVVVENVPVFLTRQVRHPDTQEPISAARLLIDLLQKEYTVYPFVSNLCDYGVPQSRRRAFLTFVRNDLQVNSYLESSETVPFPRPTHSPDYGENGPISAKKALKSFKLPKLDASSEESAHSDVAGGFHFVPVWEQQRYEMVAAIPSGSGASAWDNQLCSKCGDVDVGPDDAVCPHCGSPLLRPVIQDGEQYRLIKGFRSTSYRRMHPNTPAATVTTGSGHVGCSYTIHPYENRVLSPLECAYLQTFPTDFKWGEALTKWGHTNVRDMIGEAVPPLFTHRHGVVLSSLLSGKDVENSLPRKDRRFQSAMRKLGLE